ncbi:MAG: MBL fold metallo-hydrolase [Patescibacteria group bacterium]|nr:MBL fold metallo-hydrolase [Patescibacteria group bacterium]
MKIKLLVVGPLLTNCYLVFSKGQLLIIDPGGEERKILKEIAKTKAKPKYIINTHGHWDHTLGNKIIKKITDAKILIHEAEKNFIGFKADKFLKDGNKIKIGDSVLKIIHTPGHTKGSICLLGEKDKSSSFANARQGKNFLFTGDTLFKDGPGRTDLPGGSEKDLETSLEKLKKILKSGMMIFPGHGEIFKIK